MPGIETLTRPAYSPQNLRGYNLERHISLPDALKLIGEEAPHLDRSKLTAAIDDGKIRVYEIELSKAEVEFINSLANGIVLSGYLEVKK